MTSASHTLVYRLPRADHHFSRSRAVFGNLLSQIRATTSAKQVRRLLTVASMHSSQLALMTASAWDTGPLVLSLDSVRCSKGGRVDGLSETFAVMDWLQVHATHPYNKVSTNPAWRSRNLGWRVRAGGGGDALGCCTGSSTGSSHVLAILPGADYTYVDDVFYRDKNTTIFRELVNGLQDNARASTP